MNLLISSKCSSTKRTLLVDVTKEKRKIMGDSYRTDSEQYS